MTCSKKRHDCRQLETCKSADLEPLTSVDDAEADHGGKNYTTIFFLLLFTFRAAASSYQKFKFQLKLTSFLIELSAERSQLEHNGQKNVEWVKKITVRKKGFFLVKKIVP